MEHRWSIRTPIRIEVDLDCPGLGQATARTRDIGLGGVFVESRELNPPRNATIELTFYLGSGDTRVAYRIKARVVRVTPEGVGLMFKDYDVNTFRSLQEVIHFKNHQAQRAEAAVH
jgi:hypothetical protein